MNKVVETTDLIEIKENSIWNKVKNFFKKIFFSKIENVEVKTIDTNLEKNEDSKKVTIFTPNIGFIKDSNELRELQEKYRRGEVKESDLTEEQLKALSDLYDKQIKELRVSNEARKKRLLKYREKMMIKADTLI